MAGSSTMSLFGQKPDLGLPSGAEQSGRGLSDRLCDNPLSDRWTAPAGDSPKDILRYFICVQREKFLEVEIDERITLRLIKLLLKKYSADEIKQAISLARMLCKHPFSLKMVRELLESQHASDDERPEQGRLF